MQLSYALPKPLISIWESQREDGRGNIAFIKFRKPFRKLLAPVSGLLKKVLELANINTKVFKGYSTRSASTSKVNLQGLSPLDVLDRGSCSNESTWQKFYNKQVVWPVEKFQETTFKISQ